MHELSEDEDECAITGDVVTRGPPVIEKKSRLIVAVIQNDLETVKKLLDSPKWYKVQDEFGYNLLQIAIMRKNTAVFDYLISTDNPLYMKKDYKAALVTALSKFNEGYYRPKIAFPKPSSHFARELIKKGTNIDHIFSDDGKTLVHCAIKRDYLDVAKLLIERGADLNKQDRYGDTPLHLLVDYFEGDGLHELVTCMLLNGADPFILNRGTYTPFDLAILHYGHVSPSIETLFLYTFDSHTHYDIPALVLLKAAAMNRSFFQELLDHVAHIRITNYSCTDEFKTLLVMPVNCLYLLIDKFDYIIKEILQGSGEFFSHRHLRCYHFPTVSCQNLDKLIESKVQPEMINFISNLDSRDLIQACIKFNLPKTVVTELVYYLLSYGMTLYETDLELIYNRYGFCDLFKTCLYIDLETDRHRQLIEEVMPSLIIDVSVDIQNFIQYPEQYSGNGLIHLLDYCAHPKLKEFLLGLNNPQYIERIEKLPRVPSLVELSRNAFRKYFIQRFDITSTRQFYCLLQRLPISASHEKIISFETKLYPC